MIGVEERMFECPPFRKPLVLRRSIGITDQESGSSPILDIFYDYER